MGTLKFDPYNSYRSYLGAGDLHLDKHLLDWCMYLDKYNMQFCLLTVIVIGEQFLSDDLMKLKDPEWEYPFVHGSEIADPF